MSLWSRMGFRKARFAGYARMFHSTQRGIHSGITHATCLDRETCVPIEIPIDEDGRIMPATEEHKARFLTYPSNAR